MLSPFASLRVNSAKHLGCPSREILRCAQDDKRPAIIPDLGW